jgi:TonB family protein
MDPQTGHEPKPAQDERAPGADRDPKAITSMERARNYLVWGVVGSLVLHAIGGPLLGRFKFATDAKSEEPHKVDITRLVTPRPTPQPTPTPPPTPVPKATPPPKATQPPVHVKIAPPKTKTSKSSASSETKMTDTKGVADTGQGNTVAAGSGNATSGPATAAPPTPTPKPSCQQPNADPRPINVPSLDYPEIAHQQGWSGVTVVQASLSATGAVTGVKVYKSSGYAPLDQAGLQAARASTFTPEIRDCDKIPGVYMFKATFEAQ